MLDPKKISEDLSSSWKERMSLLSRNQLARVQKSMELELMSWQHDIVAGRESAYPTEFTIIFEEPLLPYVSRVLREAGYSLEDHDVGVRISCELAPPEQDIDLFVNWMSK